MLRFSVWNSWFWKASSGSLVLAYCGVALLCLDFLVLEGFQLLLDSREEAPLGLVIEARHYILDPEVGRIDLPCGVSRMNHVGEYLCRRRR